MFTNPLALATAEETLRNLTNGAITSGYFELSVAVLDGNTVTDSYRITYNGKPGSAATTANVGNGLAVIKDFISAHSTGADENLIAFDATGNMYGVHREIFQLMCESGIEFKTVDCEISDEENGLLDPDAFKRLLFLGFQNKAHKAAFMAGYAGSDTDTILNMPRQ